MFKYFDVDPTMLPTIIFTHVNHNKYAAMIGKFDEEVILNHEEEFKHGRIALRDAKVDAREIKFSGKDCPNMQLEPATQEDDDFYDTLAEILAEEKAKKEAEEDSGEHNARYQ